MINYLKVFDHISKNSKFNFIDWAASMVQRPKEPLPYIFLFGGKFSGVELFPCCMSMLMPKESWAPYGEETEATRLCIVQDSVSIKQRPKELGIYEYFIPQDLQYNVIHTSYAYFDRPSFALSFPELNTIEYIDMEALKAETPEFLDYLNRRRV